MVSDPEGRNDDKPVTEPPPQKAVADPPVPPFSARDSPQPDPSTSCAELPKSSPAPASDSVDDLLFGDAPLQSPDTKDAGTGLKTSEEADLKSTLQETEEKEGGNGEEKNPPEDGVADKEESASETKDFDGGTKSDNVHEEAANCIAAGSTDKPRVLPGWMGSAGAVGTGSSGGGGGGAKKKRALSASKPKKQQVSQRSDSPVHDPPTAEVNSCVCVYECVYECDWNTCEDL